MKKRILIVEDNPLEAHEISFFISKAGFAVEVASDAESGMQRLMSGNFDLLLCDLHLPGENGFELCRRIKREGEVSGVSVVLLTRYSDPLNFLRGLEAGADGFISKSQSTSTIIERVKRVLSRNDTPARNGQTGPERVVFLDTEFTVSAERSQLIEVLLSGFEDVVHLNDKCEQEVASRLRAQKSLRAANAELKSLNTTLEERVAQRTKELQEYSRKLERKNSELDQFVYMASHDLQEPLRKLISFSQLLEEDADAELNERAARDLHCILASAQRMQTLVQDLLALSRAGRSAMQRTHVSLSACAATALDSLSLRIAETNATVIRDPLPEVVGDKTTLTQLYQNLIANALRFVGADPPVIHLTTEQKDDEWIFGVRDNGIGIEPQYADQIFAPFQRLHSREEYEGTGIGLAICRTTVERHEGRIWVESQVGEGSHFKFTLPIGLRRSDEVKSPACDRNSPTAVLSI